MWNILILAFLGSIVPENVNSQAAGSGSSIKWQASIGSPSSGGGGIPINTKRNLKLDWSASGSSSKTHNNRLSANQQKVPDYPTTVNRVNTLNSEYPTQNSIVNGDSLSTGKSMNTLQSKKPKKFSREFLKLLLTGTSELGSLRSRVWTTTTTTTEKPFPIPKPSKLLTQPRLPPPPPIDVATGSSNFQVGKRDPGENVVVPPESKNILSNGLSISNQNQDSSSKAVSGNTETASISTQDKPTNSKPKSHSRKQSVVELEPVMHIGEKVKSESSLGGGMSLSDIVNSKPGFQDYVRLSSEPDLTDYSTISTTTVTKSTTLTTTAAPVTSRVEPTTTTTTTTTAAPTKPDPVFMVQSSLSQPLQFAEQLRQQGISVERLGAQEPTDSSNTVANQKMDALMAKLKGNSGGSGNQQNNRRRQNNNNGGANKGQMAAFLASLTPEQKRMFRTILGGNPPATTPPPTTTTVAPNFPPNILKIMKAMGINPQEIAQLLNKIVASGPDQGPVLQQNEGPFTGPPQFEQPNMGMIVPQHSNGPFNGPSQFNGPNMGQGGPNRGPGQRQNNGPPQFGNRRGMGPGGNNGGNMGMGPGGNNGGNMGPGGNNAGGGGNFGMGGGQGGPPGFGDGGRNSGQGLGGPDMSQMMSMLQGGGGGGGMNPLAALMGSGNEGLGGGPMGGFGGPMGGGGRGMRGQRRMMPGGPNADPQTRRILMQRLMKRGMRPGADPADPPETPSMGEGMMGGAGGMGGMSGMMNPSTAWMGGSGPGGSGGFNMMGSNAGGEGGGGLMNMFGGGSAGGLAALMGGGEGAMNPMLMSLLAGGDPADIPIADAPAGGRMRGLRGGGRMRGAAGGLPMLTRREAGPGPKPNGTSTAHKTEPSSSKSTITPQKIHSNIQSLFSFSLAMKARNAVLNLEANKRKQNQNSDNPLKDFVRGISLAGKNSKAIVEFVPLDMLPPHLLPKLKSLKSVDPKHRRRPAPELPPEPTIAKVASGLAAPSNTTKFKTVPTVEISTNYMQTKLQSIEKSNASKSENKSDYSTSLQNRYSKLALQRNKNQSWSPPSRFSISFGRSKKSREKVNANPSFDRMNNQNVIRNGQGPVPYQYNSNSNSAINKARRQKSGSGQWNPPPNMVVNTPDMAITVQGGWSGAHSRSLDPPSPVNNWQGRTDFNQGGSRWTNNLSRHRTPTRLSAPQQPSPMQPANNPQGSWNNPPLPQQSQPRFGAPLPNSWQQPSPRSLRQQQWQQPQNSFQGRQQQQPAGNSGQQHPLPSHFYTPEFPQTQPPFSEQRPERERAWELEQNNSPPQTTQRPWGITPRPWQGTQRSWHESRPSHPPPNMPNQFSSPGQGQPQVNSYPQQDPGVSSGQSSWVEINSQQNTPIWSEGSSSSHARGQPPANFNQNLPNKQPNTIDNMPPRISRNNQFAGLSNGKAAYEQPVPQQPQQIMTTTQVPQPTTPWSAGSQGQSANSVTQPPPPPQWPTNTGMAGSQTQAWGNINPQPQFGGVQQRTTTPAPIMTNTWNTAPFGGPNTNVPMVTMNVGAPSNFQNQNYRSPTTQYPYINYQGPTTMANTAPQGTGTSSFGSQPTPFDPVMTHPRMAGRIVNGNGLPRNYMLTIPGDAISDIMLGGPGHASRLPLDIKQRIARLSLSGVSADQIVDILVPEMKRRRKMTIGMMKT